MNLLIESFFMQIIAQGGNQHARQRFRIECGISHHLETNLDHMTGVPGLDARIVNQHNVTFL
jgi:hypothetical protein